MRRKAIEPLVRRTIALDSNSAYWLTALRTDTEAASDSEVIRQALMLYEELIDQAANGKEFLILDQFGEKIERPIVRRLTSEDLSVPENFSDRRNIVLHERSALRLEDLKRAMNISSDTELVRNALQLYFALVQQKLEGKRFVIREDNNHQETCYRICTSPRRDSIKKSPAVYGKLQALALQ